MKRPMPLLLAFLIGALATGPAASEGLRPAIIGKDDRVPVANEGSPWNAIGQVNVSSYRTRSECTGTLVAPDLVLTAAHCLIDRWSKAPFPLHTIHYLAGVRRSENKGHSTAKCLHFLKGYEFIASEPAGSTRSVMKVSRMALFKDVAAIVLNDRLAVEPAALGNEAAALPGLSLVHVAYPADRRYMLSAHNDCRLLRSPEQPPLWFTDCDTHHASSGGPIFAREGGALKLVAIMVATGGHGANIALPISEWSELSRARECP
jgi:protease YdgD